MGLRFRRSINLGHGVRINVSKSGVGLSAGVKGARISVGPRGVRKTASIPGTGISYSTQKSLKQKRPTKADAAAVEAERVERENRALASAQLEDDLSKIKLDPWYRLIPCIISALVIVPPLGIALMWAFSKWKLSKKILIAIPAAVWTFIWGAVTVICSPFMEIAVAVLYVAVAALQVRKIKLALYNSMQG